MVGSPDVAVGALAYERALVRGFGTTLRFS